MKLVRMMIICMNLFIGTYAFAQKIWDGEAGDSLWHNPRNWFPDGVPISTDDVLLNNSKIVGTYKILISGADSISIYSLTIQPNDTNQIVLEITPESILPVAVYIGSPERNIVLDKNSVLVNRTGASSGNIFALNGRVYIKNGGRFVHKTIRGNSYIISKLEIDSANKKGLIEFDVPGNSGYTLSLSGRKFGSLKLSANEALRKSYSGNGSNTMTVEGDFIIGENVSFTSSLTGNIDIKGDLLINGTCTVNPASHDSTGRSIRMVGDESSLIIKGKLFTGSNFNQFIFGSRTNKLFSNIILTNGWIIQNSGTTLLLDTFYIQSLKGIHIKKGSIIHTAHHEGISKDIAKGGMRSSVVIMEDSLHFFYNGKADQETGSGLPGTIATLSVNTTGSLNLTNSIEISNNLLLQNGLCKTDSAHWIVFKGNTLNGNDSSFIEGPITCIGRDSGQIKIPLGKNRKYAPLTVNMLKDETIEVEYFDTACHLRGNGYEFPVKNISETEHWKIKFSNIDSTNTSRQLIFNTQKNSSTINTYIVRLNNNQKWEMLPLVSNNPVPNSIETKTDFKTSIYTTGNIQQVALSKQQFLLSSINRNDTWQLSWKYDSNENVLQYIVESSNDGNIFQSVDSLQSRSCNECTYTYSIKSNHSSKSFYRIKALHKNHETRFSNTLLIKYENPIVSLYPNPCGMYMYLRMSDDVQASMWAIQSDGKKIKIPFQQMGKIFQLDLSLVKSGINFLQIFFNGTYRNIPFVKY